MGDNARACSLGGREENVVYGWKECEVRKEGRKTRLRPVLREASCFHSRVRTKTRSTRFIYMYIYIYICSHARIIAEKRGLNIIIVPLLRYAVPTESVNNKIKSGD